MSTDFNEAHSRWRASFQQLRAAERKLVESMRSGQAGVDINALFDEIERVRKQTSALFWGMEKQRLNASVTRPVARTPLPDAPDQREPERKRGKAEPHGRNSGEAQRRQTPASDHPNAK